MPPPRTPDDLAESVRRALVEDVGSGDLTATLIPATRRGTATVITRERAILCGRPYVDEVFRQLDPGVVVSWNGPVPVRGATPDVVITFVAASAVKVWSGNTSASNAAV